MTRQLATMVSSGMTILRALYVLEAQTENKKLAEVIAEVRKDVEAGLPLADALERHPKVFTPLFVAMTRAGETGGVLDGVAAARRRPAREGGLAAPPGQVGDGLPGGHHDLRASSSSSRSSPSSSRSSSASSSSSAASLPTITKFTVALSDVIKGQWWAFIAGSVGSVCGFRKWKAQREGPPAVGRLPPAHPDEDRRHRPEGRAGPLVAHALARSSPPASRCSQALDITGQDRRQPRRREGDGRRHRVRQARRHDRRPAQATPPSSRAWSAHMVGVGEETGALDTMLSKIADFYEDQVDAAVKSLTSILEPIMIVVVGGIVGFIVISMYLPLFKVYDQIK